MENKPARKPRVRAKLDNEADLAARLHDRAMELRGELVQWIEANTGPAEQAVLAAVLLELGVSAHIDILGVEDTREIVRTMLADA